MEDCIRALFGYTNPEGDWRGLNPLLVMTRRGFKPLQSLSGLVYLIRRGFKPL
jgi:hypothetical protein